MPRPTLADRRRTARDNLTPETPGTPPPALSPDNAPSVPSAASTVNADAASTAPSAVTPVSTAGASSAVGAGGAGTISVSLTTQQLNDARAAFLADWEHGSDATTFTTWIQNVLLAHAARTPTQRATLTVTASGQTRSFRITDNTRAQINEAVAADCAAGRWVTLSTWAAAAINAAVDAARQRGPLPTPPNRLPGRLPGRNKRNLRSDAIGRC